jgi:protein-L-isoaspartate(D-aspartate) O-methyltransferase
MNSEDLVNYLINTGVLGSPKIIEAFKNVDRADFVGPENKSAAYYNDALPIGSSQTISQPYTVAFMLELLNPENGNKIMDIGSGSCWQTCLLADIVGDSGHIYAVEIVPEIFEFGKNNALKYPKLIKRISFYLANGKTGLPEVSKEVKGFDRIICAAEVREVPDSWREQLKNGGIMVYPKNNGIYKETKNEDNNYKKEFYPGFVFVPLVEN